MSRVRPARSVVEWLLFIAIAVVIGALAFLLGDFILWFCLGWTASDLSNVIYRRFFK